MEIYTTRQYKDMLGRSILPLVEMNCMDYDLARQLINSYAWSKSGMTKEEMSNMEECTFSQVTPPIIIALNCRDYKFAKCIINYNVDSSIVDIERDLQERKWVIDFRSSLTDLIFNIRLYRSGLHMDDEWTLYDDLHSLRDGLSQDHYIWTNNILEWGPSNEPWEFTRRGFQRIIFIMKLFPGISKSIWDSYLPRRPPVPGEPDERCYVDCLNLLFRSIPDPWITKDEIREFLQFFNFYLWPVNIVQEITNEYEKLFRPKANYEPRSLKHLCRISVRKNLRDGNEIRAFPALVKDLHYPSLLKSYLLCEY